MRDQFPFAVARVTRRWRKMLDERLKDLGVTQARWSTMVYLEKGGEGLTQRELASLMAIENPTLVRLLDSLEQQNLIERRPCPNDRRARRLYEHAGGAARGRSRCPKGARDRGRTIVSAVLLMPLARRAGPLAVG